MKTFSDVAARLLVLPIRAYQLLISPLLPPSCRYQPTCSEYAIQAIKTHGVVRGAWLGLRRVGRCHPWGGHGYDPVPGTDTEDSANHNKDGGKTVFG